MSLVNLSHVCSHLQNASQARLGLTSVPHSKLITALMLSLQASGFLASVTRGGPYPPTNVSPITALRTTATSVGVAEGEEELTQANIASRRLWIGLKYWNNEPVLSRMSMVSKPKKRIWMNTEDLGRIVRGRTAGYVHGLTQPGECLFVTTDRGIMEARECVERKVGGMLLCRVL